MQRYQRADTSTSNSCIFSNHHLWNFSIPGILVSSNYDRGNLRASTSLGNQVKSTADLVHRTFTDVVMPTMEGVDESSRSS